MKAGALEFLTKPLNNDALVSEIGKALERSRLALALWQKWLRSNFNRIPDCVPMRF